MDSARVEVLPSRVLSVPSKSLVRLTAAQNTTKEKEAWGGGDVCVV